MQKYAGRILVVAVVTILAFLGAWPPYDPDGPGPRQGKLKLGIDLSGGTILVYEIKKERLEQAAIDMDHLVAALQKRINPTGTMDIAIRPLGANRIEIVLPQADPQTVEDVKQRITALGRLEFRILATDRETHPDQIRRAQELFPESGAPNLEWLPVANPETFSPPPRTVVHREGDQLYVLTRIPDPTMRVTGEDLVRVYRTEDENFRPAVGFELDADGAYRFGLLTGKYRPDRQGNEWALAIILDGKIMSAPVIKSKITSRGQITGQFTDREVDNLIAILDAGQLPATLIPEPISEDTIGPTLGEDTIAMGKRAIAIAMVVVPIFMVIYYRLLGLIAVVGLFLNLLIILGVLGWIKATFTLPGLAGLALTVGMAVDANILIYERIREERERGATIASAVRNGFGRAFITILDANVTTIITAWILYVIGTDQVRGFGLTLMVGLLANLFTAIYVSRLIFDLLIEYRVIRKLAMPRLFKLPQIDFLSYRRVAYAASLTLIAVGLIATVARGRDLLDIEFTGGTAIGFKLKEPMATAEVRRIAENRPELPDVRVEVLRSPDQPATEEADRFLLRTTNADTNAVKQAVLEAFGEKLARIEVVDYEIGSLDSSDEEDAEGGTGDETEKEVVPTSERPTNPKFKNRALLRLASFGEVPLSVIRRHLDRILEERDIDNPPLHYELRVLDTGPIPEDLRSKAAGDTLTEVLIWSDLELNEIVPQVAEAIQADVAFERVERFDSQVANEAKLQATLAIVISWAAIIAYLWLRFRNITFGLAAVVALIHDVLVTLGCVALAGYLAHVPLFERLLLLDPFKIDLAMVAAFLTIVGYSVNDTIVIFDRVRELRGRSPYITEEMVNKAINQTLGRTILTSFTTLLVAVILYVFGGPGIHGFAFAMLVGTLTGTYSTIFVASPALFFLPGAQLLVESKPAAAKPVGAQA